MQVQTICQAGTLLVMRYFVMFTLLALLTGCGSVFPDSEEERACQNSSIGQRVQCFTDLAIKKVDSSICLNINSTGDRVACIKKIAMNTCNPKHCNKIDEPWKMDLCHQEITEFRDSGGC